MPGGAGPCLPSVSSGGRFSGPPSAPGVSACVPDNSENSSFPPSLTPMGHPSPKTPGPFGFSQGDRVGGEGHREKLPQAISQPARSASSHLLSPSPHAQTWMSVPGTHCCAGEAPVPTRMGVMSASAPLDMRWWPRVLLVRVSVGCMREVMGVCVCASP